MRSRGLVVALAFVLATAATITVYLYVKGVKADTTTSKRVSVVVAKEDILAGTSLDELISEGVFTTSRVPKELLVTGVVTSLEQLDGRETSAAILAGEQIPAARLRGNSAQLPGGTLGIPEGFQAITIPLSTAQIAGGAVQAGDHVTIFATFGGGGQAVASTVVLVPDAKILKVDHPSTDDSPAASGGRDEILTTLALKPGDSQAVVFALEEGSLWLSLLPPGEEVLPQGPVSFSEVMR